jgi:hypothetical protein
LRENLLEALTTLGGQRQHESMSTVVAQRSLDAVVEHALDAGFFENIFMPFETKAKTLQVGEQLLRAQRLAEDPESEAERSEFLEKTELLLVSAADDSRQAVALWREFMKLEDQMHQRFFERPYTGDQLWRNLSLVHFGFPLEARQAILNSMEALLDSSPEAALALRRLLLTTYYDVLTSRVAELSPSDEANLALVATSLYFVDDRSADAEAVRLLDHFPGVTSCWKKVMHSMCLFRLGRHDVAEEYLQSLVKDYNRETKNRGTLAVGLAVLHYLRYASNRDWRKAPGGDQKSIEEARSYAVSGTNLVTDPDSLLYAYNLVLYVLVKTPGMTPRDLATWAQRLESYRDTNEWCYLYEDTLALFYLALARASKDVAEARNLAVIARDIAQRAKDIGPYNKHVSQTWTEIHQFIAVNL